MADPITTFIFLTQSVGVGSAVAAFVASNLGIIALTAGAVAVGNYQRRKAMQRARDAYNASLQDRTVMLATVDGARSIILGEARNVDGILFKATRGANSEFYTLIIALQHGEANAIGDVYFGDQLVALDGSGYVQTAPWLQSIRRTGSTTVVVSGGTGSVTLPYTPLAGSVAVALSLGTLFDDEDYVPPFGVLGTEVTVTGASVDGTYTVTYQYDEGRSYARVRKYLGAPSQDLSADLVADFPGLCTSADKFRGIALLRVDLEYSQDAFPTGVPQVSAVVQGPAVLDTRTSTTAFTRNPSLLSRYWALHANGGNLPSVDTAAVNAAANVCDADSTFDPPSGGVTMDTYQAGIVCKLDADPTLALGELVEAMAGRWGFSGGVLTLVAGAYRAPVATITEDWISDASQISVTPAPPRSELVNAYRPTISNRLNKYQVEPAPPVIAAPYVTADGQQLDAEITMAAVTHPLHAQHVAGVLLRDARQSMVVQLPCNLRAFKLQLFDVVAVTLPRFGWSAKAFEVLGWRFTLGGGVLLTLKEHAASVYTLDESFADLGDDENTSLPNLTELPDVGPLTVTSATAALSDTSVLTRTEVSWPEVADAAIIQAGRIEVQYIEFVAGVPAGEWPGVTESGYAVSTTISGLRAGRAYLFRARAINVAGVRGRWSLQELHTIGAPRSVGTDVYVDTVSGVAITGLYGTPPTFGTHTTIATVVFVAPVTGDVIFTAGGNVEVVTTTDPFAAFRTWLRVNGTRLADSAVRHIDLDVGLGVTVNAPVSFSKRIAVTAGVTYTVQITGQKFDSSTTTTVTDLEARVEVIRG